jgi:hypothetical protein
MSGRGGEEERVIYVLQMAQDYLTIADVGKLMHVKVTTVRELALRDVDPIPFRIFEDQRRNPLVHADEFKLWWDRNTVPYKDSPAGRNATVYKRSSHGTEH